MADSDVPRVYQEFRDLWEQDRDTLLGAYETHKQSFVPYLLPERAVRLTAEDTLEILRRRLGDKLDLCLADTDRDAPPTSRPQPIHSPVQGRPDGTWLRSSNMVGINVRTIGSFWNVVKYVLTLPHAQNSVHLLPIWEPGVVGSLYGMSSWQINTEFLSQELAKACPTLHTVERQLKATVNLLHAMGKAVGMDVIPHTDRFSEIALAHPQFFEWLQREDAEIVDHSEYLHERVQDAILSFLATCGPAVPAEKVPESRESLFSEAFPEDRRLRILFGAPEDREGRFARRNKLVHYLHSYGYEPVPATMAPPFRGLGIDSSTRYVDSQGNTWYDYLIAEPQSMSRVFNPLARYKLYGRLNDNIDWEIDFDRPRREVWDYVCRKYHDVQRRYGFDFMRGDMSHVQMRPAGVPDAVDETYDILRAVKNHIRQQGDVSHFGYYAETFLAPRNCMVYGDEVDHLEASDADATLGDLQSTSVGSPVFLQRLRQYHDLLTTRSFAPCFTVITGDKDDPRFDQYYMAGNALRLFIALFLTDMPSYTALGFETRDVHLSPAPNEHYTKLYVFQERSGPKATTGPYVWGRNGALFGILTRLKLYVDGIFSQVEGRPTHWLVHPDPTGEQKHIAWTQSPRSGDGGPDYVFVANTDTHHAIHNFNLPRMPNWAEGGQLEFEFSTARRPIQVDKALTFNGRGYRVLQLAPGEGRVYRVVHRQPGWACPEACPEPVEGPAPSGTIG